MRTIGDITRNSEKPYLWQLNKAQVAYLKRESQFPRFKFADHSNRVLDTLNKLK